MEDKDVVVATPSVSVTPATGDCSPPAGATNQPIMTDKMSVIGKQVNEVCLSFTPTASPLRIADARSVIIDAVRLYVHGTRIFINPGYR